MSYLLWGSLSPGPHAPAVRPRRRRQPVPADDPQDRRPGAGDDPPEGRDRALPPQAGEPGPDLGAARRRRDRTLMYRLIEQFGRWPMVDVFMTSILTAL